MLYFYTTTRETEIEPFFPFQLTLFTENIQENRGFVSTITKLNNYKKEQFCVIYLFTLCSVSAKGFISAQVLLISCYKYKPLMVLLIGHKYLYVCKLLLREAIRT